jgi:23S rRNA (cytosine1962-C5)-methyltransferase
VSNERESSGEGAEIGGGVTSTLDWEAFENRVRKNFRHRSRWARRRGFDAWRLYDHDVPGFPITADRLGEHIHAQVDSGVAFGELVLRDRLGAATGARPEHIWIKWSDRLRTTDGKAQYERIPGASTEVTVTEGPAKLWVNLSDYFDVGLFVDHRPLRRWVGEHVRGARFLNLFCYTGAFTVHAALGGAVSTTSVDLSPTYLLWLERNLALNGVTAPHHRVIRGDALQFLYDEARTVAEYGGGYDIILLDPPTFSNSKRTRTVLDVRRDHPELIHTAMRLLDRDGLLVFSTNARRFRLDDGALEEFDVEEVTEWSCDEDCLQTRPHRAWFLRHGG